MDDALTPRIDAALQRVRNGHAPMRIPTDMTDVDVVLHDCRTALASLRAECDALRAALVELVACDEIVKHQQHADGTKVRGGRWKAAWEAARAALAAKEGERA